MIHPLSKFGRHLLERGRFEIEWLFRPLIGGDWAQLVRRLRVALGRRLYWLSLSWPLPYTTVSRGRLSCQNSLPFALLHFYSSVCSPRGPRDVTIYGSSRCYLNGRITEHVNMPVPPTAAHLLIHPHFNRDLHALRPHPGPSKSSQVVSAPAGTKLNCLCPVPPQTPKERDGARPQEHHSKKSVP